jgi:GNAT superfamily N-acetyltransferase
VGFHVEAASRRAPRRPEQKVILAMSELVLRPAEQRDHEALVDLKLEMTLREQGQAQPPIDRLYDLSRSAAEAGVARYWSWIEEHGDYVIAELEGRVVGSALWFHHQPGPAIRVEDRAMALVCGVAVAPEARGRGVASALMEHVEAGMRTAGVRNAMLEVTADNRAAKALYAGRGYHPFEIAMVKPLGEEL